MINASSTKMVPPITPPATGPATDASAVPIKDRMYYEYYCITTNRSINVHSCSYRTITVVAV